MKKTFNIYSKPSNVLTFYNLQNFVKLLVVVFT